MSLTLGVAFLAGLAIFFSPCILPILPGYLAVLSGGRRGEVLKRVLLFSAGMILTFTTLGILIGVMGQIVIPLRDLLTKVIGVVLVIFGVHLLYPKFLTQLSGQWKLPVKISGDSDSGAVLLGATFGIVWTPCTGAILGLIMTQALLAQTTLAAALLATFSLGVVVPMVGLALIYQRSGRLFKLPSIIGRYYNLVVGLALILLGLAMTTGWIYSWQSVLLNTWPNLEQGLLPPIH